jgi:hypothetical protein
MAKYPANRKSRGEIPLIDRFLPKVSEDAVSGCWLWNAKQDALGYGWMRIGHKKGVVPAHRVSWILFKGPIPQHNGPKARMLVLHKCDNPSCVNPDHLFLGTDADNCADRDKKGRLSSKLKESDVRSIRKFLSSGMKPKEISGKYQVSTWAIEAIRSNRRWAWLQ